MKNYFMPVIVILLILLYGAHGEGYSYKQATSSDVSLKVNNNNSNSKSLSQANLYTGDLVVNYPITNFGGISLNLIYNSNVHNLIHTKNEIMQSGWVGLGWKLEIGCIVGDINNTKDLSDDKYYYIDQNGTNELILIGDNKFNLN